MPNKADILVIGGDMRQKYIFDKLIRKGVNAEYINEKKNSNEIEESVKSADIIILPLPVSNDGENIYSMNSDFRLKNTDFVNMLRNDTTIFGGSFSNSFINELNQRKIQFHDYYLSDTFVLYNAFLTAQGAFKVLLENTNEYVINKKALVTGFGKVGKATANLLKNNGLKVFVAARNDVQLMEAECLGYKTLKIDTIENYINLFDFIFSTVPERIINSFAVSSMKDSAVYFEIASYPYGADKSDFNKYEKKYILANGLPGKHLASSAGEAILEACRDMSGINILR